MNAPKKTLIAAIMLLALLFTLFSFAAFSKSPLKESARSAVLYEPTSGEFLYEKNADDRLPMASTTKIMTALVALRKFSGLDEEITVDERACGIEGSSAYFRGGEIFTLYDLLHIMMLRSANDAAMQIAYTVSGDVPAFAALMNETASELGLENTNFTNPSGLDDENHYTTARELAIITAEAMKYDVFREIVSKRIYTATDLSSNSKSVYVNHNKLLTRYEGCIGVKTGYTKRSGRSLVSAAQRDGVTLIAVTINAPNDWTDHTSLLDFGFSQLEFVRALTADECGFTLPVVGSEQKSIYVKPAEDFGFVARRGTDTELIYDLPKYLIAPIKCGDVVGKIKIKNGGVTLGEVDIIATADADKNKSFLEKIIRK